MNGLTHRQREIVQFILSQQSATGTTPSLREIAGHFGFRSMNAARAHVQALRRKGVVVSEPRRARSIQVLPAASTAVPATVEIPILGSIPAGLAEDRKQEAVGHLVVDASFLPIRPNARLFALVVSGDSMIGKHIVEGDRVILDPERVPKDGDVVAALIDNQSTLKTFAVRGDRPVLRAENPKYPEITPAEELAVQGVMIGLVRRQSPD